MKYMKFLIIFAAAGSLVFGACDDSDDYVAPDGGGDVGADTDTGGDTDANGPQPLGAANKPALGTQLDRVGRPAVTTALVGTFTATADATKDSYNTTELSNAASFASDIEFSLGVLDGLNVTCGDQPLAGDDVEADRYLTLATVLTSDTLLIRSTDTACPEYLGLEGEVAGLVTSGMGGCGGRIPTGDVVDRSYSVLAAGALAGVGDGVDSDPDGMPSNSDFPFLLAPTN